MSEEGEPLSWEALKDIAAMYSLPDPVNGPTNPQAHLRLFGQPESNVRVVLYRDNHAWCPYCQKVWLWLEEKRIPYQIKKVTMFCYGDKEDWYKRVVPSGMLPALELDGKVITESDVILLSLEKTFGPIYKSLDSPESVQLRKLERYIFRAWCGWLCYPSYSATDEEEGRAQFISALEMVNQALSVHQGPYFLAEFSEVDLIFTPYIERMLASLYAYKGFNMRDEKRFPHLVEWFAAMETRSTYRGTQSDFHTHVHDLPPQMGGCYATTTVDAQQQQQCMNLVNNGPYFDVPDVAREELAASNANGSSSSSGVFSSCYSLEALYRVVRHKDTLIQVNPDTDKSRLDVALRCVLTNLAVTAAAANPTSAQDILMLTDGKKICVPPAGSSTGLRYLRDRVSVPRDMSIFAAKHLRSNLENTAAMDTTITTTTTTAMKTVYIADMHRIPVKHRRDQNPLPFRDARAASSSPSTNSSGTAAGVLSRVGSSILKLVK